MTEDVETLAAVLGRTAKKLRGEHTIAAVLPALRAAGLDWASGHIGHLENGRTSPTLSTLYALASGYGAVLGRPLTIADLLAGNGSVRVGTAVVSLRKLRAALGGKPVPPARPPRRAELMVEWLEAVETDLKTWPDRLLLRDPPGWWIPAYITSTDTDSRIAQRIADMCGVSKFRVTAEMGALWDHSLTAERDRIAGPHANAQKRGRITRALAADLERSINRGDDS